MRKTISQLISSFMVLLALLMVPYFVGLNLVSNDFSKQSAILDSSAQSSNVLGANDFIGNNHSYFEYSSIMNFALYFIGFLSIVAVISFLKYKVIKV